MDNGGTFAVQDSQVVADNAGFTDGTTKVFMAGHIFDETAGTALTENDAAASRIDSKRAQIGVIEDATTRGQRAAVSAAGRLSVDASGVAVPVTDNSGSLTIDNAALSVTGGGTESGAQRVTIASDSTGVLSVDDNGSTLSIDDGGSSITVDGTVGISGTVTVGSHAVTNAGTFATQESGSALTSLQLIDDTIFADDAAFTVGTSKVSAAGYLADESSTDSVDEGDIGAARMTLDRKLRTVQTPHTSGGLSIFRTLDADETEEDVKTSAGQLFGWYIYNDGAAEAYVKIYNATAANVTVGSTTPVLTIPIPAGSAANVEYTNGLEFSTAICIAATTGVGDADTTAPAANQVVANIFYK